MLSLFTANEGRLARPIDEHREVAFKRDIVLQLSLRKVYGEGRRVPRDLKETAQFIPITADTGNSSGLSGLRILYLP
jgi:hypothetical protein